MARPTTKEDLIASSNNLYKQLNDFIGSMSENELTQPFDFSADGKKKELHWKRDKNLRDVLIHLYEWQQLLLNWVNSNTKGKLAPFLPLPYNWRTYSELNIVFYEKHQGTALNEAIMLFEKSHEEVMNLATSFTNDELFSKGRYDWVGGSTLGSYFVSATASHYDWALKKLKAHRKNVK